MCSIRVPVPPASISLPNCQSTAHRRQLLTSWRDPTMRIRASVGARGKTAKMTSRPRVRLFHQNSNPLPEHFLRGQRCSSRNAIFIAVLLSSRDALPGMSSTESAGVGRGSSRKWKIDQTLSDVLRHNAKRSPRYSITQTMWKHGRKTQMVNTVWNSI